MNMPAILTQFWRQRTHAERRTLALGGAVLVIALLYAFIWQPLSEERRRLESALPQMRNAATQMRIAAAEVTHLRNSPPKTFTQNLGGALNAANAHSPLGAPSQIMPMDAGRIRLEYNAVSFDGWIDWANLLQTEHGVRIESAEITALAEPGMVKIKAVLASVHP